MDFMAALMIFGGTYHNGSTYSVNVLNILSRFLKPFHGYTEPSLPYIYIYPYISLKIQGDVSGTLPRK
jgi:hypothetical protein